MSYSTLLLHSIPISRLFLFFFFPSVHLLSHAKFFTLTTGIDAFFNLFKDLLRNPRPERAENSLAALNMVCRRQFCVLNEMFYSITISSVINLGNKSRLER